MQVLTDNYLNVGLGAESALENERQLLVEEQKSCRVRARKFSVETNRRRKNLEERRKQWVIQEKQLQENILQQRRQRVQDATERFQRAHLPPSQRRRQSFRKATPNIEETLHRIQGSFNSHECRSPFLSTTISRSCTPSPKPPTAPRPSHSRSAVEAYANMLQERSMACFKGSQQMFVNEDQVTRERDRDTLSPQEPYAHRLNHSDSLSSLDSLENVDPSHRTFNIECFNSRTQSPQRSHNDTSSDTNVSPLKNPISDDFIHWHSLHSASKAIIQEECEELNNCVPNLPDATYRLVPAEKPQLPLGHCNLLSLCDVIDGDTRRYEESTDQNSPRDKPTANINVLSGNAELEFSCLKAEKKLLDRTLHSVLDNRREKHESATEMILSAKKDTFPEGPFELNNLLNHNKKVNTLGNTTTQHATKEDNCPPTKMQCSDSVNNNLNKVSNAESKEEMSKNTGPLYQPCLSNIKSNSLRCFQHPEEHLRSTAITYSDSKICEVQFVKGILKKRSKYVGVDAVSTYGPEHLMFARQVLAIRDSIELMRTKTMDADNSIKKKLRWFDQVSLDAKDKEQSAERKHTQMRNKRNSEDHRLATLSGASVTSQALVGDHLTKQAWADAGVHAGRLQEQGHEVKTPRNATKTVRPKVPRRECSARAGAGPVSWRARKGTLVRPQSAAEVSQIAHAQGKMMAPRPPPRTDSVEEKQRDPTAHSGVRASSRGDHAGVNCDHTEPDGVFSPRTRQALRAHSGVACAPLSHACQCPEGRADPGQQESQKESRQSCGGGARGFCLACTPTDEEISMLWCGVRRALASKDARAILSHVTLTDGSLISCVKSVIRTGGFFLSPCNARGMARRQACDGSGARRKMCVEQSSHFPASGSRRLLLPAQPTKQATVPRLHTTYDPVLPDEGLESHCQTAQTHGQDMLGERDIMVATETVQTQRPGGAYHCSQQPVLTAMSLEERRLLLSLDRLNHQLQCVQEHAAGGFVQVPSEERTRDGSGTANQKYRILSADGCSRHQRRF